VLPERGGVERTHDWNERACRLIMHHDRLAHVSEAWGLVCRGPASPEPDDKLIISSTPLKPCRSNCGWA
jgi:hypothetical protein